jgi:hypothetical protein
MNINFYNKLSLQIAILFLSIIFVSFIPDYLHSFFGDWICVGGNWDGNKYAGCDYLNFSHNPRWHWGPRHWWWAAMMFILSVIQVVRIAIWVGKNFKKD